MSRLHEGVDDAANETRPEDSKAETQAAMLLAQVQKAEIKFVHSDADVPYALIRSETQNGSLVLPIHSPRFRALLSRLYYKQFGKAPSRTVVTDVLAVMEGLALFDGDRVEINLRYRTGDDSIDIDLGDEDYQMVHVAAEDWSIRSHAGTYFRRPAAMLPLPKPSSDRTSLTKLKSFINANDENFLRILIWIVCAMRGRGPFPILALHGEQGSAKTTAAKILKALVDPGKLDARAPCRDTHDLAIAADGSYALAFDNLSDMSPAMADAVCRLSTGGSFATRTLYTDRDEEIFEGQRPQILTSIEDLMTRPDLADRTIPAHLDAIPDEERKLEDQLWSEFRKLQPQLFGALLDALVIAFKNLADVRAKTRKLPRMADAYLWSLAAESAFGLPPNGVTVSKAWDRTRDEAVASALEASIVASPFMRLLQTEMPEPGGIWETTASGALHKLNSLVPDQTRRQRAWPSNGKSLINKLHRIAPALRAKGFTFRPSDRRAKFRGYAFSRASADGLPPHGNGADSSSSSSRSPEEEPRGRHDSTNDANDATESFRFLPPRQKVAGRELASWCIACGKTGDTAGGFCDACATDNELLAALDAIDAGARFGSPRGAP